MKRVHPRDLRDSKPDAPIRTLREVADELGITNQRVAQIEASAFKKLEAAMKQLESELPRPDWARKEQAA